MDIHNIAVVRVTNAIPLDGVVRPVKDVPFIKKGAGPAFAGEMFSLLRRKGILKPIDMQANEQDRQAVEEENKQITSRYMPYTSIYNSMVLWSVNGIVPDDGLNKFSAKECYIIDGLEEQMEQGAKVVSMYATDLAIKGEVPLSKSAILGINRKKYDMLSKQQQEQLTGLGLTVDVFDGDLKTAIDIKLKESGRYTAENLCLVSEGGGFKSSPTSVELAQTIKSISREKNIPQIPHINVFLGETNGEQALEDVKGEKQQCDIIADLYQNTFFEYIFSRLDIDEDVKINAQIMPSSDIYMENLCDEIARQGIDKYKVVLDEYNGALERLRDSGRLPSPQQIIDVYIEGKKLDLVSMVRQEISRVNTINNEVSESNCKTSQSFRELLSEQTNTPEEIARLDVTGKCDDQKIQEDTIVEIE